MLVLVVLLKGFFPSVRSICSLSKDPDNRTVLLSFDLQMESDRAAVIQFE